MVDHTFRIGYCQMLAVAGDDTTLATAVIRSRCQRILCPQVEMLLALLLNRTNTCLLPLTESASSHSALMRARHPKLFGEMVELLVKVLRCIIHIFVEPGEPKR